MFQELEHSNLNCVWDGRQSSLMCYMHLVSNVILFLVIFLNWVSFLFVGPKLEFYLNKLYNKKMKQMIKVFYACKCNQKSDTCYVVCLTYASQLDQSVITQGTHALFIGKYLRGFLLPPRDQRFCSLLSIKAGTSDQEDIMM